MTTVLESLNNGLHNIFKREERAILIGEDLLDPYGGAFKVSKGLSEKFPKRVFSSPISEAGIVGIAAGMALRGLYPIAEIMFGDFTTLIADQVINSISKFQWMYGGNITLPIVIRTPMGGRRGYGPTHSQTLEKLFLGVPGLQVIAPSHYGNPGHLLEQCVLENNSPILFVENKVQYLSKLFDHATNKDIEVIEFIDIFPSYKITIKNAPPPKITIACYGYMAILVEQAILKLAYQHEIFCEVIVNTQLSPFNNDLINESLQKTGHLITVEEGTITNGWGAEIIAQSAIEFGSNLIKFERVAADDSPIPAATDLENQILPQIEDIIQTAIKIVSA